LAEKGTRVICSYGASRGHSGVHFDSRANGVHPIKVGFQGETLGEIPPIHVYVKDGVKLKRPLIEHPRPKTV